MLLGKVSRATPRISKGIVYIGIASLVSMLGVGGLVKDLSPRLGVKGVDRSSHSVRSKSLFVYVSKARISNRGCMRATITGNTNIVITRGSVRGTTTGIPIICIPSANGTVDLLTGRFCNCPDRSVGIVNIAKAGKGAAIACLIRTVLGTVSGGAKLVNAVRVRVNSRIRGAGGAAPSDVAVRGTLRLVARQRARCFALRLSSVTLRVNET